MVMTALTTIFGLVPMAIGDAGIIGIPYSPLGRSVIGGLLASTLLVLFFIPYLYAVLMQTREVLRTKLLRAVQPLYSVARQKRVDEELKE